MDSDKKIIPSLGTTRLPRYWRGLKEMLCEGSLRTTSGELAKRLGLSASQVRADLRGISGAGQQGYGYDVKKLYKAISRELGVGEGLTAVFIGGNEGTSAYLASRLEGRGIMALCRFCNCPQEGVCPKEISIRQLPEYLSSCHADMAVILDSESYAIADLADLLIKSGIRGIWNATQKDIQAEVPIVNLPFGDVAMSLGYAILDNERKKEKEEKS